MNTIDAYSVARHFEVGGKWSCAAADLAANFPSCKMLFHWDDIDDGAKVWTDRRAGVSINAGDSAFVKNALGVSLPSALSKEVTGTLPAPSTNDFAITVQGTFAAAPITVEVGDSTNGAGVGISGNNANYLTFDASNYLLSDTLGGPPTYPLHALSVHADLSANDIRKAGANSDGTQSGTSVKAATDNAGTITQDWPAFASVIDIPTADTSGVKTLAFFVFATPLSATELAVANKWMAANPGKLYPGFAGKS